MGKIKIGLAAVAGVASIGFIAAPAGAATPAVKGCVGSSLSVLAKSSPAPGAFGHTVASFAQDPNTFHPGLGDGIQLLQLGLVPDEVVPNTCNG